MAIVPEFISVLRDIRDTKYPQINAWYNSIFGMNSNVEAIETNLEAIQIDVTNKNNSIKNISVINPVTSVPNQPNGNAGSANVIYNPVTNQFDFYLPIGEKGESMRINGTVPLIVNLYGITVNTGNIYFVEEDSSNYVKLDTGVNTGASDWSNAIPIVPAQSFTELNDVPSSYTGQHGKIPVVSDAESSLVFKTGAELGIIGYNYVKNPLFENQVELLPYLATTAFGSDQRGYGSFDIAIGTPTLASDNVRVSNGVTIANTYAYTKGKSVVGIRIMLDVLTANSTIVNCGNFKIILNASSQFAITDGTLTNSLTTVTPNITDKYEIYATDQELVVLNLTTGLIYSSTMNLTITEQTSGSIILGGNGAVVKYYAILVQDKSAYVQVDGLYEEFARDWTRMSTGGEVAVIPDIEGYEKGIRFVSGGLSTNTRVRMNVGDGGQFSGKEVTFSFTAYSSGVGANSITTNFVTDRGSQVLSSRLITQSVGAVVLDNGIEKNYSVTFTVSAISDGTFLDADAKDYFEFVLPASAKFWIVVKKPKFEISALQTEFTPQGGSTAVTQSAGQINGVPKIVLPTKVSASSILVDGVTLSLNTNLDTGVKIAGTDYYFTSTEITADKNKVGVLGGFHYGVIPEAFTSINNITASDATAIAGINAYSIWTLWYRAACGDNRGMFKAGRGKWYDLYLLNIDHHLYGTSSAGKTIAGGTVLTGRGFPKIPLFYGGNGTVNYGTLTWFEAAEIGKAYGKDLISYEEFAAIAYGVLEASSAGAADTGVTQHLANYTSKFGVCMATGCQWIWGKDLIGPAGAAWNTNTKGRGQIYNASLIGALFGGNRDGTVESGSRASHWFYSVWNTSWNIGSRYACDHLEVL